MNDSRFLVKNAVSPDELWIMDLYPSCCVNCTYLYWDRLWCLVSDHKPLFAQFVTDDQLHELCYFLDNNWAILDNNKDNENKPTFEECLPNLKEVVSSFIGSLSDDWKQLIAFRRKSSEWDDDA